jgi:hypothetical protein
MRFVWVLAVAATAASAATARAQEWCGFHENTIIQCGYTSAEHCQTAVGKDGKCYVDPEEASLSLGAG